MEARDRVREAIQRELEARHYHHWAFDDEVWDETLDEVTNRVIEVLE